MDFLKSFKYGVILVIGLLLSSPSYGLSLGMILSKVAFFPEKMINITQPAMPMAWQTLQKLITQQQYTHKDDYLVVNMLNSVKPYQGLLWPIQQERKTHQIMPTQNSEQPKTTDPYIPYYDPNIHVKKQLADPYDPNEFHQGIYLSIKRFMNITTLQYYINQAKKHGIDTIIVDLYKRPSEQYQSHVAMLHAKHLHYIPRIEIFPQGGHASQVLNPKFWQPRWILMKDAINMGAASIQLDYIRYASKPPINPKKVHHIHDVILWFKHKAQRYHTPLQMVIFGIVAYKPTHTIGQDIEIFSDTIDTFCPTLYPSHFQPYHQHAQNPYRTVYRSLLTMHKRLQDNRKPTIIAYIEPSNFRIDIAKKHKKRYIMDQIQGSIDGKANGWYAWSNGGFYNRLFAVLPIHPKSSVNRS